MKARAFGMAPWVAYRNSNCTITRNWIELLLEVGGVVLDRVFLVLRSVCDCVDRFRRARRNAGATVDAALRIDLDLRGGFEAGRVRPTPPTEPHNPLPPDGGIAGR